MGAFVIALASGLLYEQAQRARDRERFPQIGRSTDIGSRLLNIYCSGAGQPAVIFESGAPWPTLSDPRMMWENGVPRPEYSWVRIQAELAKTTTGAGMIGQVPAGATSALTRAIARPRLATCMLSCGRQGSRRLTC